MKPASTCRSFHFNSSTLFAYEVICHGFASADIFSKSVFFVAVFSIFFFFLGGGVISEECQAVRIQIMPVGSDLGLVCLI